MKKLMMDFYSWEEFDERMKATMERMDIHRRICKLADEKLIREGIERTPMNSINKVEEIYKRLNLKYE